MIAEVLAHLRIAHSDQATEQKKKESLLFRYIAVLAQALIPIHGLAFPPHVILLAKLGLVLKVLLAETLKSVLLQLIFAFQLRN